MRPAEYEWDERKRIANLGKHGLDFRDVHRFEWETAVTFVDDRRDYGEIRYRAYGRLDGRVCAIAFTIRGETARVISLRHTRPRETRRHGF
jgi:uncharacterized DUF497 family protein